MNPYGNIAFNDPTEEIRNIVDVRNFDEQLPGTTCGISRQIAPMMAEEYTEEESISVLPVDEEFCEEVDASIQQSVASTIAPLERRLLQITHTCPVPLELEVDTPQPCGPCTLPTKGSQRSSKRRADSGMNLSAFECLKKAFLTRTPHSGLDDDPQALLALAPDDPAFTPPPPIS
ncbi:hypothetical protein NDU88_006931 [Pleurodeles waltl]|uniref:Uncharacterized protein n=1 Tax=Pleurodeles waltl TaxID=8319 RepID=A0AAV7LQL0_PLEWA|nr:hypothetical protein NDU88_006931 [Pleurodeles waltl]